MAFLMIIIFLLVAVAGRIAIHYRTTGDHGVRSGLEHPSKISKLCSILLVGVLIGVLVMSVLSFIEMLRNDGSLGSWETVVGTLICLFGVIATSISQHQMGDNWRLGIDDKEVTELVSNGIYSRIRHPIYSSVMVFGMGLLILIPTSSMFIIMLIGYISIELHVRVIEEPHLKKLHGKKYFEYMQRTNRYLPKCIF